MNLRQIIVATIAGVLLGSIPIWGNSEEDSVEEAFYAYKVAIMNDRGAEAATLLSSSTVQYYEDMRDLALFGPRAELEKQSTVNLSQALILRHRVPTAELRDMSGLEVLTYAIDHGWVGKNSVAPFEVSAVHVVEGTAIVDVTSERDSGQTQMPFVNENGHWKLDLTFLMKAVGAQLDLYAQQQGLTREEFIFAILSSLSGEVVDETIWQPPLKSGAAE